MAQAGHPPVVPQTARVVLGDQLIVPLVVQNAGSIVDRYRVQVDGIPPQWYTLATSRVTLFPGASERISLVVHPPAGPASRAGCYPISVETTSELDPAIKVSRTITLMVEATDGLRMDLGVSACEGHSATFKLTFRNQSSTAARVALAARDREGALRFRIEPPNAVEVPSGGVREVTAHVEPTVRKTIGEPRVHEIEFLGLEGTPSSALNPLLVRHARFTYVPQYTTRSLPGWLRRQPAWMLLFAPLLVVLFLVFAGNGMATVTMLFHAAPAATPASAVPLPQIKRFAAQLDAGGTEELVWSVTGASEVRLNGRAVARTGHQALSTQRPLATFVLSATNERGTATQVLQLAPTLTAIAPTALPPLSGGAAGSGSPGAQPTLQAAVVPPVAGPGDTVRITLSCMAGALVHLTVSLPGQRPLTIFDVTDSHGQLSLPMRVPRDTPLRDGGATAQISVQAMGGAWHGEATRTLKILAGR